LTYSIWIANKLYKIYALLFTTSDLFRREFSNKETMTATMPWGKGGKDGNHLQAQNEHKREAIPVDIKAIEGFNNRITKLEKGEGVSFFIDLTDEEAADMDLLILMNVPINEEEEPKGDDRNE
jgi:hypothetical protein